MKFLVFDVATGKFLSKDWQPGQDHVYAADLAGAKVFDDFGAASGVCLPHEIAQPIAGDTELLAPDARVLT